MANVDDANKFICALSFKNDKHLVQHASKLPCCNHYVCKRCLEALSSRYTDIFKCAICGKELKKGCINERESKESINEQLEKVYPAILKTLVNESGEKINCIESKITHFL